MRFRRRRNWFLDERPKDRTWIRNFGILLLIAYAMLMTLEDVYDAGGDQGYEQGFEEGQRQVHCPRAFRTMAAPAIID